MIPSPGTWTTRRPSAGGSGRASTASASGLPVPISGRRTPTPGGALPVPVLRAAVAALVPPGGAPPSSATARSRAAPGQPVGERQEDRSAGSGHADHLAAIRHGSATCSSTFDDRHTSARRCGTEGEGEPTNVFFWTARCAVSSARSCRCPHSAPRRPSSAPGTPTVPTSMTTAPSSWCTRRAGRPVTCHQPVEVLGSLLVAEGPQKPPTAPAWPGAGGHRAPGTGDEGRCRGPRSSPPRCRSSGARSV